MHGIATDARFDDLRAGVVGLFTTPMHQGGWGGGGTGAQPARPVVLTERRNVELSGGARHDAVVRRIAEDVLLGFAARSKAERSRAHRPAGVQPSRSHGPTSKDWRSVRQD